MRYVIDLDAITLALYEDPQRRMRIARDYGFPDTASLSHFVECFLGALDQRPTDDPLALANSPSVVFRAAVRSLGSNSRAWTSFCRREPELRLLLKDYDPCQVTAQVRCGGLTVENIKEFFPGTTAMADARAVLLWARRLSERDFNEEIRTIATAILHCHDSEHGKSLPKSHLMPALVAFLANPPVRWPGGRFLSSMIARLGPLELKLPGMGPALGSEFLRNLGWSGFKPDRHVMRLLDRWAPELVEDARPAARALGAIIGRSDSQSVQFLSYSLAGQAATPDDTPYSRADNLLWALGAYVEKKGRESDRRYLIRCED